MNDKIKINLKMAGAYYPITIRREEEEMVREAARQVDTRLNQYKSNYARDQVTTEQLRLWWLTSLPWRVWKRKSVMTPYRLQPR